MPDAQRPMRFHATVSENESTAGAVAELVRGARSLVGRVDLAVVFFSAHHHAEAEDVAGGLWRELDPQVLVGCSAEGVLGGEREVERAPGVSLLVGEMPGVRLRSFHVPAYEWKPLLGDPDALAERVGCGPATRAVAGFGDPFTTPLAPLLPALDAACPGAPLVGGMASAARRPGGNALVRDGEVLDAGMVGVSLAGPVDVETIVSQGARPVGRPFVITKARENVIEQLGGRPALTVLRELVHDLPPAERELLGGGLLIGRAINEYKDRFGRGDFLVRNLAGVDQEAGSIAVADFVRVGQTVQFHARDARTASEDLTLLLEAGRASDPAAAGGLLISCNGRGTHLFDVPCHDVSAARKAMPHTPLAGFFAAGEFGPVGGRNFVHGHTASLALFRPGRG